MNILNQYGAILAIFTLVISAAVYLYGTAKKGRRDYLRSDNLDLSNSNNLLRQKIEGLETNVKTQSETIINLRDVATQTPEVKQLLKTSAEQQVLTARQHGEVITQLTELTKEMAKLTREFSHVATAISKNSAAQTVNSAAQKANTKSREASQ